MSLFSKILCALLLVLLILSMVGCSQQKADDLLAKLRAANTALQAAQVELVAANNTPTTVVKVVGLDPNTIAAIFDEAKKGKDNIKSLEDAAKENPVATYSLLANIALAYFAARKKGQK